MIRMHRGTEVYSGYAGGISNPNDRDVAAYPTILSGDITIRNSVIKGNQGGSGGGLFQQGNSLRLTVINSLISGNQADVKSAGALTF